MCLPEREGPVLDSGLRLPTRPAVAIAEIELLPLRRQPSLPSLLTRADDDPERFLRRNIRQVDRFSILSMACALLPNAPRMTCSDCGWTLLQT